MPKPKPKALPSLAERLRKAGIRHFDQPIHKQSEAWLIENFRPGREKEYPVNVTRLIRNLLWQMKERVAASGKPFHELLRTYWYMYVKPTLSRAGALAEADQYKQLSEHLVGLVKVYQVMKYKDIGFRDENEAHKKVGLFANVIVFAEKEGQFGYLSELFEQYHVSVIALGGQPSVMNIEYFVDEIKAAKINLRRSFYLFGIVDFDPSGWIIRDAFVNNLRYYGIKNIQTFDLVHPDMLKTPEEVIYARYSVPAGPEMEEKNRRWYEEVTKRHYAYMKHLVEESAGKRKLYGLQAESVSAERISLELERIMKPVIGGNEGKLKIYEMNNLDTAAHELILFKATHPEIP